MVNGRSPSCEAAAVATTTTTITIACNILPKDSREAIVYLFSCSGHDGHHGLRALGGGGGADGIALNETWIFLFFSTYLRTSVTMRVDHSKARRSPLWIGGMRPVARIMVVVVVACLLAAAWLLTALVNSKTTMKGFGNYLVLQLV